MCRTVTTTATSELATPASAEERLTLLRELHLLIDEAEKLIIEHGHRHDGHGWLPEQHELEPQAHDFHPYR